MHLEVVQPFVSEPTGAILATGLVSILTAAVTLILTNRHARREAEAQRREPRRAEVRRLVSEFVHAGVTYATANDFLVPIFYKAAGESDSRFWTEWPDTDTGRQLREDRAAVTRSGRELNLVVGDKELQDAISNAIAVLENGEPLKALLDEARETHGKVPKEGSAMAGAFAYFRNVKVFFSAVETVAATKLQVDL